MRIQRPGQKILTIGNPGLSVISPRGGGAAIPWYLAGGVSAANCVAAYQPIGAASYAVSKVNLANPGTYDAVRVGSYDPNWGADYGWDNFGLETWKNAILKTGYSLYDGSHSVVCRFSNAPSGNSTPFGWIGSSNFLLWYPNQAAGNQQIWYGTDSYTYTGGAVSSGVAAFSGNNAYFNGSIIASAVGSFSVTPTELYILGFGTTEFFGRVQAISIYNTAITADQVSAITTAMNAL